MVVVRAAGGGGGEGCWGTGSGGAGAKQRTAKTSPPRGSADSILIGLQYIMSFCGGYCGRFE